jgi:hypothetical protein
MRRIAGVVIFVIGIVLIGLGLAKVVPVATQPGFFACFIGLVVFGLSFIPRRPAPEDAPPPLSPMERITTVFYDPKRVFENLHFHPRWLAGFLVIAIVSAIYHVAFVQRVGPEIIALAPIEKTIESGFIPADRADQIREQTREAARSPLMRVVGPLNEIGGIFIFMCILAGLLLLLVLVFGGRLNFWQALCVAVYSSMPPMVVEKLISLLLLYLKSPDELDPIKNQAGLVKADLSILFKASEHPVLYVIGSSIGLLTIYGLWLEANGLRYGGEKLSSASAWTIVLILWGLGLLLKIIGALLFPAFLT